MADIDRQGNPMLIARCVIDQVYDDQRQVVRERMRAGESLEDLMAEPFTSDLEGHAATLLRDANMYDKSGWVEAFALKSTIEAAKAQRLFAVAAFRREDRVEFRLRLKIDASREYARLACEAMDLLPQVNDPEAHGELVGVISEQTVLALLNRGYEDHYAANLATGIHDHKFKIDARLFFRPDDGRRYDVVNLQIKTSKYWDQGKSKSPTMARMFDEHQIVTIVANDFVTSGSDLRRATTLLDRERKGIIGSSEIVELTERSDNMIDYVFRQVRLQQAQQQMQEQAQAV